MGRIISQARIENALNGKQGFDFSALVDTGTSHLTLPSAWRSKLGEFQTIRPVELETANQSTISGEMAGPVKIQIEGFPAIYSEVLFVDMEPRDDGSFEPLIGYIVLESCQAGVDIIGHRLVHIKYLDLK
ncbi:MAG: aspartyl protease family protein [Pyrinomonadaceae bacterium]